jgi:hypothetical protein
MQKGLSVLASRVGDNVEAKRALERLADNADVYVNAGDQMTIQARPGTMPENAADSQKLCEDVAGALARLASRPLAMHECRLLEVSALTALYIEHDAPVNGTRTIQFWFQREPGKILQFTMNCRNDGVAARRQELREIVASVRW